jgi:hypothetical protein
MSCNEGNPNPPGDWVGEGMEVTGGRVGSGGGVLVGKGVGVSVAVDVGSSARVAVGNTVGTKFAALSELIN